MSVESAKWAWALGALGFEVLTVAGSGPVDRCLPGLAIGAPEPPTRDEVLDALAEADLVVVENLCSLPLNPAAGAVVAGALAGRATVLHHHDLPWQRAELAGHPAPPDDPHWRHVTINELSRAQLLARGITATTIYNRFDPAPFGGSAARQAEARNAMRAAWHLDETTRLVLQPTRALPRKNVAGGIRAAAELGAVYWLLGVAEDGFGPELERLVDAAEVPVLRGWPDGPGPGRDAGSAYAACDVVVLPSTWEGFGNPAIESAVHRRPLVIGPYPVGRELASFGFDWFGLGEISRLGRWLDDPDASLLDRNARVAATRFALEDLPSALADVLPTW
ncbi:MAG: glycosyltransferase [Actinomycetota bacterium]|nr:glycosyltransferase [Actinomycetota bacterium]